MGKVREHEPVIIEEINGLWARGDDESCPLDHLLIADNIQFFHSGVETRTATKPYAQVVFATDLRKTRRIYNYNTPKGQSQLVLVDGGKIFHVVSPTEIYPVLTIPTMEDFAFISIAGRAYISPFKTYTKTTGEKYSLALPNEYVYVYDGDKNTPAASTGARRIGGDAPVNGGKKPFIVYNHSSEGKITEGFHVVGISFNGGIIGPEAQISVEAPGDKALQLINIPIGPGGTTSRTIVMTKAGIPWAPGTTGTFYTAATIPNNTDMTYVLNLEDKDLTTVYVPGGTAAPVTGAMFVYNPPTVGFCDTGFHLFGVVYETSTGYLTAPGPEYFTGQTLVGSDKTVRISNVPVSLDSSVVKRHIVATKWIPEYNGDQKGYQFFFVPKGTLENNTSTTIDVNFYDSDLVADASHLIDNFTKVPAGVNFCQYHGRLVIVGDASYPMKVDGTTPDTTKPDNRSVAWLSAPGEPESFNQVTGLIITPLDGNPLTNCEEFRDILYLFKANRTYAYSDNDDDPSTWKEEVLDQGIGASVHGIAEVLDSGGVNVDYLIIADWSGLMLFNGTYARPELSWKIENVWMNADKNYFHMLQLINDSIRKRIWIVPPPVLVPSNIPYNQILVHADYGNGLDPKSIRWSRWTFESIITSIALTRTDKIILGTWQGD